MEGAVGLVKINCVISFRRPPIAFALSSSCLWNVRVAIVERALSTVMGLPVCRHLPFDSSTRPRRTRRSIASLAIDTVLPAPGGPTSISGRFSGRSLSGAKVKIKGKLKEFRNAPEVVLDNVDQITIVEAAPAEPATPAAPSEKEERR